MKLQPIRREEHRQRWNNERKKLVCSVCTLMKLQARFIELRVEFYTYDISSQLHQEKTIWNRLLTESYGLPWRIFLTLFSWYGESISIMYLCIHACMQWMCSECHEQFDRERKKNEWTNKREMQHTIKNAIDAVFPLRSHFSRQMRS